MKYIVKYTKDHFCISTLALLNGDLDLIANGEEWRFFPNDKLNEYGNMKHPALMPEPYKDLKDVYNNIIKYLESCIKSLNSFARMRKIKKEYKRVLKIYKRRLDVLIGIA